MGVQCYELFGGIALKNRTFSLYSIALKWADNHDVINVTSLSKN